MCGGEHRGGQEINCVGNGRKSKSIVWGEGDGKKYIVWGAGGKQNQLCVRERQYINCAGVKGEKKLIVRGGIKIIFVRNTGADKK